MPYANHKDPLTLKKSHLLCSAKVGNNSFMIDFIKATNKVFLSLKWKIWVFEVKWKVHIFE